MPERHALDIVAVFPEINDIKDTSLRRSVVEVWDALWAQSEWTDIADLPTSVEFRYPHVPHNRCVLAISLAIADCFERFHGVKANRDHLIAAAVLQDASKLVEYCLDDNAKVVKTEIGRRYPHAFYGAHVALEKGVPSEVVHIMLYHSPQAPKFPESLEGKIIYFADQIDVIAIYKDRFHKELFITKEPETHFDPAKA